MESLRWMIEAQKYEAGAIEGARQRSGEVEMKLNGSRSMWPFEQGKVSSYLMPEAALRMSFTYVIRHLSACGRA